MTAPEARRPQGPGALERLILRIGAAIHTRALYDHDHPQVRQALDGAVKALEAACDERRSEEVTFLIVGEDLVVDQRPLRRGGPYQQSFVETLRKHHMERLTLARGLDAAECEGFVSAMAGSGVPSSTPHLIVGRVELAAEGGPGSDTGGGAATEPGRGQADQLGAALSSGLLESAREAFARWRTDRVGRLGRMEELVWSMMQGLSQTTREVIPLAALKDHDEYTFHHSTNVSLLVLAQARSFGVTGERLHAMGLAGLLHDIGKLALPRALLNKTGRLEDAEWRTMMAHVELGLWALAGSESSHSLAMVVAYEHHLRFDGRPNYPALRWPRQPSLVSQMTAVADIFDALCSIRPYHRAVGRAAALEILKARAGTFYDPQLVGNFWRLMATAPPASG